MPEQSTEEHGQREPPLPSTAAAATAAAAAAATRHSGHARRAPAFTWCAAECKHPRGPGGGPRHLTTPLDPDLTLLLTLTLLLSRTPLPSLPLRPPGQALIPRNATLI